MIILIFIASISSIFSTSLVSSSGNINVPALYIFGDSILDGGNSISAYPNGIDLDPSLPHRPTNGLTIADYIALSLGLPLVPPFKNPEAPPTSITGINYAYAGSFLLPDTPPEQIWNFDKQIDFFISTMKNHLAKVFSAAEYTNHMKNSIFLICFGINDYRFYINRADGMVPAMNSQTFAKFLMRSFSERLMRLYRAGARKFVVKNVWPLGCAPLYSNLNTCNKTINDMVLLYHNAMPLMLQDMASSLDGFEYTFSNDFYFLQQLNRFPQITGITNTMGKCWDGKTLCVHRDMYLYFDIIHPTQAANRVFADNCFNGTLCSPQNIAELVGLGTIV